MALPRPLEPAAGPSNSDRLIHDPFTDTEVLVDPFRNVLVFASSSVGLESQASGALHAGEDRGNENGIDGVVCQTPENHCVSLSCLVRLVVVMS